MADIWQVQDAYWNSFGLPAFDDQTKFDPDGGAGYPHITYESFSGVLDQQTSLSINLWYRSSSWREIKQKAEQIRRGLASGVTLYFDSGYLWLKVPESGPFAQPFDTGSTDSLVKRILITVEAEALTI